MTVRQATEADAEICAAIYRPYVTDTWISFELAPPGGAEIAKRIAASAAHGWRVFEHGGEVLGFAYGSAHRTREAYARSADVAVYVRRDKSRQGIGRRLYEDLLPALFDKGFHALFAGIALPNPASIALHTQMGFRAVGTYCEVGWKQGGWRDVGWWQLHQQALKVSLPQYDK
jgi:L-amino acid N-acyltransferase YncA